MHHIRGEPIKAEYAHYRTRVLCVRLGVQIKINPLRRRKVAGAANFPEKKNQDEKKSSYKKNSWGKNRFLPCQENLDPRTPVNTY